MTVVHSHQDVRRRRAEGDTAILAHSDSDQEKGDGDSGRLYSSQSSRTSLLRPGRAAAIGSAMAMRNLPLFAFLGGLLTFFYVFYVYQAQSNEFADLQEQYQVLQVYNKKLRNEVIELKAKVEQDRTAELLRDKKGLEVLSQELHKQMNEANEKLNNATSQLAKMELDVQNAEMQLTALKDKNAELESTMEVMKSVGIIQESTIAKQNMTIDGLNRQLQLKTEEVRELKHLQGMKDANAHRPADTAAGHVHQPQAAAHPGVPEDSATPAAGINGNARYEAGQHHEQSQVLPDQAVHQHEHQPAGQDHPGDQPAPVPVVAQHAASPPLAAHHEPAVDVQQAVESQQVAAPVAPGDRVKLEEQQADANKQAEGQNDLIHAKAEKDSPAVVGGEYEDDKPDDPDAKENDGHQNLNPQAAEQHIGDTKLEPAV